ncbi:hypothetical protein [Asticcacaulis sp. EMRT-3]|uniref:hypothetical protein n=1 Tax=Asticcacaulis sp. EMRT-3 TaxID=3040349 RepID=UPI0024AED23C|nr:hypothetical protein [Asticcacaulis sp. EMRT-3]MDI7774705.1 hypothetical protein [Asticcacaulis sp. EMRT-3]
MVIIDEQGKHIKWGSEKEVMNASRMVEEEMQKASAIRGIDRRTITVLVAGVGLAVLGGLAVYWGSQNKGWATRTSESDSPAAQRGLR